MLLVGVNRSPYTRRVAITLNIYGVPFEQRPLSGFDNRADVRMSNPLGRIPALVLDENAKWKKLWDEIIVGGAK